MSLIRKECIDHCDTRKICVVEEKGKKYELKNNSGFEVRKIRVDKCLSQGTGEKRCDFLVSIDNDKLKRAIFIELKGGKLTDAVKQIYDTVVFLRPEFKGFVLDGRIIGSRDVPNIGNNPIFLKLRRELKVTGGDIDRATNGIYSENI